MALVPASPAVTRSRSEIESALRNAFLHFGVQLSRQVTNSIYHQLRGEVNDFVWRLNDAVYQGAQSVYNFLSGISTEAADYFFSSQGMPKNRQNVTPSPLDVFAERGISGVRSRVYGIAANLKKVKNPERRLRLEDELEQWNAAYNNILSGGTAEANGLTPRQSVASNLPEEESAPAQIEAPEAQRGVVRPAEEQLEAPEAQRQRTDTPDSLTVDDAIFAIDEATGNSFGELIAGALDYYNQEMAGSTAAAAGGSANSQFQSAVGRIGPNMPRFSPDGSLVTFSGSRLMYTWNYNFKQCDVPDDDLLKMLCYNGSATNPTHKNVLDPLGHEVPWDWVPFYCTANEWKSAIDPNKKCSITKVGCRVTPVSKSTFFMTGATQSTPVATEHPVYVYYFDGIEKDATSRIVRLDVPDGTALNPDTFTFKKPDYVRLRNRLWGPTKNVKGDDNEIHCGKGVSRQLEQVSAFVLPASTYTNLGCYKRLDERRITKSFNEVLGKPMFQKIFAPSIGLIHDPVKKAIFLPRNKFYDTVLIDERFLTNSILMTIPGLDQYTKDVANPPDDRVVDPIHTGTSPIVLQAKGRGKLVVDKVFQSIEDVMYTGGEVATGGTRVLSSTSNQTVIPMQNSAYIRLKQFNVPNVSQIPHELPEAVTVDNVTAEGSYNQYTFGNESFANAMRRPGYTKTVSGTTYKFSDLYPTFSMDSEASPSVNFENYHRKIDVGDSFLPMGADRDCFPGPKTAQEPIIIGVKPIRQLDPAAASNSYLKCMVEWKIDYFMEITREHVDPTILWTEANEADTNRTIPLYADYTPNIPSRGLNIVKGMKTLNNTTSAEVATVFSGMVPPEYSDMQQAGYNVFGRTARGKAKYDGLTEHTDIAN